MAEMETVEDKATEIVLNAVKNIPLIGCDPTPILENSAPNLTKILTDSIDKTPWFKKSEDESECNTRKAILSAGLYHKVGLKVMTKMVEAGLSFSAEWTEEGNTYSRLFVSVRLFFVVCVSI